MSRHPFYDQTEDLQIAALQRLAADAMAQYGMPNAAIKPLAYRENMTFAIDAGDRGRFALRVHQAGYRTDAQVQSELDFMDYLNNEGVRTPKVIHSTAGTLFVYARHADVDVPRQCDLFEWIDGREFRQMAETPPMSIEDASATYMDVGRQAAAIYNASEKWTRPKGFDRPAWDEDGICGPGSHLGDFRDIQGISSTQRRLLEDVAERVTTELAAFGKTPDRYGLSQADFLPENIMLCGDGIRIIDFDDAGDSWIMFDVATAFIDLADTDYFEPCLGGFVAGFRELRPLPDEQLAMLPTFMVARLLSYLGHTVSRKHLEVSKSGQEMMLGMLEEYGALYLAS